MMRGSVGVSAEADETAVGTSCAATSRRSGETMTTLGLATAALPPERKCAPQAQPTTGFHEDMRLAFPPGVPGSDPFDGAYPY